MATVAEYLTLKTSNSSLGRYWIANQDIPCGTLLIQESPIACVPNCQLMDNKVKDPILNEANSLCWNCCALFPSTDDNHHCTAKCKSESSSIIDILLNPSLPFNKSIANGSTLRLTTYMILKMVDYCIQNKQHSLLSNIDETFTSFTKTPSKFYAIFAPNRSTKHIPSLSLQHTTNQRMDSNKLYQSYLSKLSEIIPLLKQHLQETTINENDLYKLSTYLLNIVFINAFGIHYSVVHDEDMLGLCLFEHTSFFNHSCSPNAFYHFTNGNQIIIRTLRDVSKHEALTIAIVDDLECHSKTQRQRMLSTNFGFKCICTRCVDDEYVNNDELLTERMTQTECILNDKQHKKLLNFARSNWKNATHESHKTAWKFYKRLFNEYRFHYHPFDPDVLSLLQEISQKAFMIKDYQIGYDAAELGREFSVRLASCNIVDNCHLTEFKFIFLSFINYLHLMKDQYPLQDIEKIMNMNVEDDDNKDIVVMNDDILAQMFEDDICTGSNHEICEMDENHEEEEEVLESMKCVEKEEKHTVKEKIHKEHVQKQDKAPSLNEKQEPKRNKNKRKNKTNRHNHKKQGQKKNSKNKKRIKQKQRQKKKKGNHWVARDKKRNKNVTVYTFGASKEQEAETKDEDEEEIYLENTLEYELNEKIIEFFATRSILFPKFEDFQAWLGKDLLLLDERIQTIVTSLKDKFEENV